MIQVRTARSSVGIEQSYSTSILDSGNSRLDLTGTQRVHAGSRRLPAHRARYAIGSRRGGFLQCPAEIVAGQATEPSNNKLATVALLGIPIAAPTGQATSNPRPMRSALRRRRRRRRLIDSTKTQLDASMQVGMVTALGDTMLSSTNHEGLNGMRAKRLALFDEQLA